MNPFLSQNKEEYKKYCLYCKCIYEEANLKKYCQFCKNHLVTYDYCINCNKNRPIYYTTNFSVNPLPVGYCIECGKNVLFGPYWEDNMLIEYIKH